MATKDALHDRHPNHTTDILSPRNYVLVGAKAVRTCPFYYVQAVASLCTILNVRQKQIYFHALLTAASGARFQQLILGERQYFYVDGVLQGWTLKHTVVRRSGNIAVLGNEALRKDSNGEGNGETSFGIEHSLPMHGHAYTS